ncbi:hypothetical protein D1007_35739 [Hordeum vulgare]|nr:hypothetical protein D1007_35739 [Hordeum vulgare]
MSSVCVFLCRVGAMDHHLAGECHPALGFGYLHASHVHPDLLLSYPTTSWPASASHSPSFVVVDPKGTVVESPCSVYLPWSERARRLHRPRPPNVQPCRERTNHDLVRPASSLDQNGTKPTRRASREAQLFNVIRHPGRCLVILHSTLFNQCNKFSL